MKTFIFIAILFLVAFFILIVGYFTRRKVANVFDEMISRYDSGDILELENFSKAQDIDNETMKEDDAFEGTEYHLKSSDYNDFFLFIGNRGAKTRIIISYKKAISDKFLLCNDLIYSGTEKAFDSNGYLLSKDDYSELNAESDNKGKGKAALYKFGAFASNLTRRHIDSSTRKSLEILKNNGYSDKEIQKENLKAAEEVVARSYLAANSESSYSVGNYGTYKIDDKKNSGLL